MTASNKTENNPLKFTNVQQCHSGFDSKESLTTEDHYF